MKRFLAVCLALCLVFVSAPPASWAQVGRVLTTRGVGTAGIGTAVVSSSPHGSVAAVVTGASHGAIPMLSLSVLSLAPTRRQPAPAISIPADAPRQPAAISADPKRLAEARHEAAEAAGVIEKAPAEDARSAATRMMDRLLGIEAPEPFAEAVSAAPAGILAADLAPAAPPTERYREEVPPPHADAANGPRRSKAAGPKGWAAGAFKAIGTIALGAAAAIGLHIGAAALFPAIFGVVPVAAVWAVSSGLLLFPLALYARWRLARRDSPRLDKVKMTLDVSLGAFLGAVIIAVPGWGAALTTSGLLAAAAPLLAAAGVRRLGCAALADSLLVWGALALTPGLIGVASAGLIGLSPIIGLMALPAMTTIAFFLGRLIHSAETGAPFAAPGAMAKIRFPSFQWVMIGVVFGLLTGYSAVYTTPAFIAWTLLGSRGASWKKNGTILKRLLDLLLNFDAVYLGLLVFAAATGFASPLTFLVIAFSGERAALWTERLLARFLMKSSAAPSTASAPIADPNRFADAAPRWPAFHYRVKTFLFIGSMGAAGFLLAAAVFGVTSLLTNLAVASALALIPFVFAKRIVKFMMKAKPTTKEKDPEFFAIMEGLRDKINAGRRARGKKEIPMPEMVIDPMPAPNAYATGRGPFSAMVGVTAGMKTMTLDPENVRAGLVRLVAASDPGAKEFKVFRRAIAGSISAVPAEATPSQVAAVVFKAGRSELKALGARMLRGVLGHEYSHVLDRHMLLGSMSGAIASGVALASYGVMWAVGRARVAVKKAFGRRPSRTAVVKPEVLDPISTGIVIKSLPALLRLFAALWAPVVLQILQMASSRNNEGMADEDGALLSEDPEALALGLGLLTAWRPPPGFPLPGVMMPRAASMQHIMIVNPLEQLGNAAAGPKGWAAGPTRADDLLFELFITHPNTGVRVRKLHDMSEALKGLRPGVAADRAIPRGSAASTRRQDAADRAVGEGMPFDQRGLWRRLTGLLRVLPDANRNHQFWIFTLGQALAALGVSFNHTALPKLVAPAKEDAANLGYNRAINWGAQAAASLLTGPFVDRASTQKVILWTHLARSLLMLMVPILFFHGMFGFGVFAALIGVAGFVQLMGMTAGSVALNRILDKDEAHYNRANAISTIVMNVVGVVGPLLAGAFIAAMDASFGLLAGNALSYAVYGVLLLAVGVGYSLLLRLPRDEMMSARRELDERLKHDGVGPVRYAGVTAGQAAGRKTLFVEVDGDPALAADLPAEFGGFPVRAVARRRVFQELAEGFKTIFSDRFLRLDLFWTTLAVLSSDALLFAALPRFIEDVLKAGAGSFGLFLAATALGAGLGSGLMVFARDPEQMALAAAARTLRSALAAREPTLDAAALDAASAALRGAAPAVLARYKAEWSAGGESRSADVFAGDVLAEGAAAVGRALGRSEAEAAPLLEVTGAAKDVRAWAARRGAKLLAGARAEARGGIDRLQRQWRWTSWAHGLSWLAYAALFFMGSLYGSVALMLVSALLGAPVLVAWTSLVTKIVAGSYPESQGTIYSAIFFYELLGAVAGVLFYGWLMAILPTMTVLWIAGGVMVACAAIDFFLPALIYPRGRKPAQ